MVLKRQSIILFVICEGNKWKLSVLGLKFLHAED